MYEFIKSKFNEYYYSYYNNFQITKNNKYNKKYKKKQIPKAIREQVWITYIGEVYENKCSITWCSNKINVFNFQVGHNIPESKGGDMSIKNLRPICGRCNLSMGNEFTIDEWEKLNENNSYCNIM